MKLVFPKHQIPEVFDIPDHPQYDGLYVSNHKLHGIVFAGQLYINCSDQIQDGSGWVKASTPCESRKWAKVNTVALLYND